MVDILRGALPLPLDYKELHLIGKTLNLSHDDIYIMWETRVKQVLESSGFNLYANSELADVMLDCAKKYFSKEI